MELELASSKLSPGVASDDLDRLEWLFGEMAVVPAVPSSTLPGAAAADGEGVDRKERAALKATMETLRQEVEAMKLSAPSSVKTMKTSTSSSWSLPSSTATTKADAVASFEKGLRPLVRRLTEEGLVRRGAVDGEIKFGVVEDMVDK